jgi:hypothetical protein
MLIYPRSIENASHEKIEKLIYTLPMMNEYVS